jgi:hypothetical protein
MSATSASTSLRGSDRGSDRSGGDGYKGSDRGSDRGSEKGRDRGSDKGSESYPPSQQALPRSITQSVKSETPLITKKKNTINEKDSGILVPGPVEAVSGTVLQDWDTADLPPDWERRVDKDLKVSSRGVKGYLFLMSLIIS